jgi:hypothetical protein
MLVRITRKDARRLGLKITGGSPAPFQRPVETRADKRGDMTGCRLGGMTRCVVGQHVLTETEKNASFKKLPTRD